MALHTNFAKRALAAASSVALLAVLAPGAALADEQLQTLATGVSSELAPIVTEASPVETVTTTISEVLEQLGLANGDGSDDADGEGDAVVSDIVDEIADAIDDPEFYLDDESDEDDESEADSAASTSAASTGSAASASSASSAVTTQADETYAANTLTWKTDPGTAASSWYDSAAATTAHGTAELVKVDLANSGGSMTAAELAAKTTSDTAYYKDGVLCAPTGSEVTIKMLPARGYQLLSETICSGKIEVVSSDSDDDIGYYTFEMPSEGMALDCGYVASKDIVEVDSTAVTAGTITNADAVVTNGTLELDIDDMDSDDEDRAALVAKASNASDVVACLDMTLYNIINQGSDDASWDSDLESLPSALTLTLTLSDSIASQASSFYIIREHDGNYQQASVTFDSTAKTITFKTDKFSYYAIVKGTPGASTTTTTTTPTTTSTTTSSASSVPQTGDTNDPAPLAAAAFGSAIVALVAVWRIRANRRTA